MHSLALHSRRMPERVAIFGASSAIAAEVARIYAKRGARLCLIARDADKLKALEIELAPQVVYCARQDFDRTDEADGCVQRAVQALGQIDVALIAHGLLGDQRESELNAQVAEDIARTNYLSVVALLIPLANHFEAQRAGHLAVLSSVAAERGRPRNYTYAAAKSALNIYLQGVRSRLYRAGVQVHTLKLGPVDSPMTVGHAKNALFTQPDRAARGIVRAIDRGLAEAYVPGFWRLIMPLVRNLPEAVFQRIGALSGR
jgi:decaprenylphospho-beta-D-erythro-pentofuranosid-2-ulose 2-reductase